MHKFKQVLLVILDGWGHREDKDHNAIAAAHKPFFDHLWQTYPHSLLDASGEAVGLPEDALSGSEVGHMTIGAGRPIESDIVRINRAISDNRFGAIAVFEQLFTHTKKYNSTLHVIGMVSNKGVHSHQDHLHEFLKSAKTEGIKKVVIHAITDGRDTPPQSAQNFLRELENLIADLGIGYIATASGRFWAMDRDHNWDRLKKAEDAIFHGQGQMMQNQKPSEVIAKLHAQGIVDEHLKPIIFLDESGRPFTIQRNDGIFFFNFRADRARMMSQKILERSKTHNLCFVTMTEYDKTYECLVAFPPVTVEATLSSIISQTGRKQVHITETEKYAHLTYFFNGEKEDPHDNERFILIDSHNDVPTHDLAPRMRAREIADKAIEEIKVGTNLIVINFANPDMVGHTAKFEATVKAIEEVDWQLKRVVETVLKNNGAAFITADHGNAEMVFSTETGQPHTAHTTNPVPAILTIQGVKLKNGALADVAPTILELFQLPKPNSMTGHSLFSA